MGDLPSPSEYIKLVNSSVSQGDIQIDYIEITAPVYDQWPTRSHKQIFFDSENKDDEAAYACEILTRFMPQACLLYTSPSPRDATLSRMPSSA